MKTTTLEELIDKVFGSKDTPERDKFDSEFEQFLINETNNPTPPQQTPFLIPNSFH